MSALPTIITPKAKDLGDGFVVRRALPAIEARRVGPFIFLDEMGPTTFAPGQGLDVRPHPHIGLATVTYLFDGAIEHRDSLGTVQTIRPGDVNWMTSGRGIVHSERSPHPRTGDRLHGIQFWVALPAAHEEDDPAFLHTPGALLPLVELEGAQVRVIIGAFRGAASPVRTPAPMIYLDLSMSAGAALTLGDEAQELALYVVSGAASANATAIGAGELCVFAPGHPAEINAHAAMRAIVFGGDRLDGPRKLWWNFVSSRPERIEQAKQDWRDQRMGVVPGETDFIPLPSA